MVRFMSLLWGLVAAAVAGALGGALVGVGEVVLVTWTAGAADEYWLFLFAVITYGLLGGGVGVGVALVWQVLGRGRTSERALVQVAAAVAVAVPLFAVARYHVTKRIFSEGLVLLSRDGVLTHVLLLLAVVLAALATVLLVRTCYHRAGRLGTVTSLLLLSTGAVLIGLLAGTPNAPTLARRSLGATESVKPNIILIVADTLRADAVDWAGVEPASGGGFSQLGADGVVFERAYAQSSWARPSIATILTAQYPSVHQTIHKMDFLPERVLTLAEALRDQGYWTAAFTTNINVAPIFNFQQGFDEFAYLEPSFYFWATDSATRLAIYKGLRTARERFVSGRMYFEHYYQDAVVVDEHLNRWFAQAPREPFFLFVHYFVHYMDPHDPFFEIPYNEQRVARVMTPSSPPESAAELHRLYLQDVRYLDAHLKRLLDRLRSQGIYDRTVMVFTSDHGEEFYEHEGWWHGTALYEEQVQMPLVVKRAMEPLSGQRRGDMVRTIDIAPTVMAAAGLPVPSPFMGIDLFSSEVDEPLLAEEDFEGNRVTSICRGPWKLFIANPDNPRGLAPTELYNLDDDPGETRNLASTKPEQVNDLLTQLEELRARIAAGHRSPERARYDATDPRA